MAKLPIEIVTDKFDDFLSKLEELAKLSDTIKIKIDSENLFIYSIVGETAILAFKNYILNTDDYFKLKSDIQEQTIDIIIPNAKKYIKNLTLLKKTEKILLEVDYRENDDILQARFVQIKNGKFKIGLQGGENYDIRDITKETLAKRLDLNNKKWSFKISKDDFIDIKKLSTNNSDGKILNINVINNKVIISETSIWELEVDNIEYNDKHLIINKMFISHINDNFQYLEIFVFESFILIVNEISNFMISFEQDFSSDD